MRQLSFEDMMYYRWRVNKTGYQWIDLQTGTRASRAVKRSLVPVKDGNGSPAQALYMHSRYHTGLFREFADLAPNEDAILEFAAKYGLLGVGPQVEFAIYERYSALPESLEQWKGEILKMKEAVAIWDAVRASRGPAAMDWITFDADGRIKFASPLGTGKPPTLFGPNPLENPKLKDSEERLFRQDEPDRAAKYALVLAVNDMCRDRVFPMLRWDVGWDYDREERRDVVRMHHSAKNLLGAMWYQMALAINGGREYRSCEMCGVWFEVSRASGKRKTRRHCNDTCRIAAFRARKAKEKTKRRPTTTKGTKRRGGSR